MGGVETGFATVGSRRIGYIRRGSGTPVLLVGNWLTNCEAWEVVDPLERFGSMVGRFADFVHVDMPGSGISDPLSEDVLGSRDDWVTALDAVLDSCGWPSAWLMGWDSAAHPIVTYAVARPGRVDGVVLADPTVTFDHRQEQPPTPEQLKRHVDAFASVYATPAFLEVISPSNTDPVIAAAWARWQRQAATPSAARARHGALLALDSRQLLPDVHAPVVVLQSTMPVREQGSYIADRCPNARLVELPWPDLVPILPEHTARFVGAIEEVVTGEHRGWAEDRVLVAVLFTDIVGSTPRAAAEGDARWRELLERHAQVTGAHIGRLGGRVVNTTGDGAVAVFSVASAAIEAGRAVRDALQALGVDVRIGIHVGEVETLGGDIGGIAVHVAARVQAAAAPGEILVTAAVPAVTLGGPARFENAGVFPLKGVPGEWTLYRLL